MSFFNLLILPIIDCVHSMHGWPGIRKDEKKKGESNEEKEQQKNEKESAHR